MKGNLDRYRQLSLSELEAEQSVLESRLARCCYSDEAIRAMKRRGRTEKGLAIECLGVVSGVDAEMIKRKEQIRQLKGME